MTSFWDTDAWHAYEIAYGDEPGTRAKQLASATWSTQVIDLTLSEAELWTGVRKSYKSKIHWAERQREISLTEDPVAVGMARAIHMEAAGRETRPMATWLLMADWLVAHQALLVMAPKSFAYFLIHDDWAYYGSAASLEPDVNAALIWTAMKELKARGVRQLEMGWQGQATDDKGKGIEFFRRGFGGEAVPVKATEPTAYDRVLAAWPDRNALWNAHSAAQFSGVPLRSARRALRRLLATGFVEKYGTGRSAAGQLYRRSEAAS